MRPEALRPPVTLVGSRVVLRPLENDDAEGLLAAARDPEVSRHLVHPPGRNLEEVREYIAWLLDQQRSGTALPFVILLGSGGPVIGATRLHHIDRANDSAEIGTWLDSAHWRTGVNREVKAVLLRHAFEAAACHRISFLTDVRNERSQAALAGIGAVREGIVRDDHRRADGSFRSSVLYSILADEWPGVRARLAVSAGRPVASP